ncbi:hypothetical protein [Paenibacillus lautus]|uniref:hypothetical protein n=1 Tax=Paenibacillus lautus TaxID=1401 RepID=UPI001C1261D0|nr:hypothetical protein [Paenibacillus lautus]MBU5349592.1 hypothetical protein [Paenibacillus lautus]
MVEQVQHGDFRCGPIIAAGTREHTANKRIRAISVNDFPEWKVSLSTIIVTDFEIMVELEVPILKARWGGIGSRRQHG